MNKLYGMGLLTLTLAIGSAYAFPPWAEVGDAPALLPGQLTIGSGSMDTITGELTFGDDADMYLIAITSPATFSATTVDGAFFDSQLFLFTASGLGIAFNDDSIDLQSTLPAGDPLYSGLAPGIYLLAVSGFNSDPSSADGPIFPDAFPGVFGPTGPGAAAPVTSWSGSEEFGKYTIALTGAGFGAIPGPAGLAVLGLAGLTARRRRA